MNGAAQAPYLEGEALVGVHQLPYDCWEVTGHIVPVERVLVIVLQHRGLAEPYLQRAERPVSTYYSTECV